MKPAELNRWMKENDVTAVDIASALKISPVTIFRFLKGKSVHRSTLAGFQRLVASHSKNIQATTGAIKTPIA